ncbi:MAG: TonB-dependent receptor [Saprospiraceae bacterium]|nr:TonB-dependent receptor [Saprospiraceae bacterium]
MKNLFVLFFTMMAFTAMAQVTTASLGGLVSDEQGAPMIGATVIAMHVPTGSRYAVTTFDNGRYNIKNMRVGGPYTITVDYIGFSASPQEGIFLELGQRENINFQLSEQGLTADEVVITASQDPILNGDRTGPSTAISSDDISSLPTISRSASDYTRLNPMSAEGGSFAGRNDQFNNYSLDGAIFNNPFGLDAATPGGQSNAQPISLDAIEQINVAIAPYDVTQSGFTGASINSVSKSGTNEFKGAVFGYFRNASMTGGTVDGEEIFKGDPKQTQFGFSVGGPIVKNKVFFFANFEKENRSDLGSLWTSSGGNSDFGNSSRVSGADMDMVSDLLMSRYGYDTGAKEGFTHNEDNYKGLFKLDFNLGDNHKLSATYNFLNAFNDNPAHPSAIGRRGPDFQTLQFENSGYRINNDLQQFRAELKSFFGSKFSNKFSAGITKFRDDRDPKSTPFPVINISKDNIRYIIAGHEPFSINNVLDQDVIQIKNELNIFSGDHTWTVGAAFERFDFNNSFNLGAYGGLVFAPDIPIEEFADRVNAGELDGSVATAAATFATNNENDSWALAETNLGQASFYIQDELQLNDKLSLTAGIRLDMPLYFDTAEKIQENLDRNCCYDPTIVYSNEEGEDVTFDHTTLPSSTPLINPRIGFNYDVKGDRSEQLRGGTGLFSGRFPFVWIGNQVANPNFFFYNMTDPDFKFPQIWRSSLGYDKQFGNGWIGTVDLLYTKDLQAQVVNNYGLKLPTGTLQGADDRPIYTNDDRVLVFGAPTNAYVFTNVDGGSSFNASVSMQKNWNNTFVKLAYNYLNATDVMSIDAEISSDAYDRNPANIAHTNRALVSPSLYGNRHRIVGVASKKFQWSNENLATTVSLFFEYAEGNRYSYTYSGDINNDGSSLNDLIYIPTDAEIDGMTFTGQNQASALKAYIAQDDYLSANRGDYAEKYGALSPWYSTWDLRILQDVGVGSSDNKFQISIDILNVGNLINSSWGVRQFATGTSLAQPIGVAVTDGVPVYSFDTAQTSTFFNDFSVNSRWRMQLGLRYSF